MLSISYFSSDPLQSHAVKYLHALFHKKLSMQSLSFQITKIRNSNNGTNLFKNFFIRGNPKHIFNLFSLVFFIMFTREVLKQCQGSGTDP